MADAPTSDAVGGLKGSRETATQRVRRRNRMITSCLECRRRKLKCDKTSPCTNCIKFSRDCIFLAPALDSVSQKKMNEIKEKMGSLERTLEEDVVRLQAKKERDSLDRRSSIHLPGEGSESDADDVVPDDEKGLHATSLATLDGAYEEDTNEDVMDLGFRVGKFRMSERLGGLFRPKIADEMAYTLSLGGQDGEQREAPLKDRQDDFLEPGPSFIPPGSGFIFGDIGSRRNLMNFLPTKQAADVLVQHYYNNVHFVARIMHWPTFQLQYDNFWTSVLSSVEPPYSLQALFFAVLMSAVASMEPAAVEDIFQAPQRAVLVNFQTGVEVSLGKAQFLRTTKLETLQALVMYLIPMCREEISRAHSVLVGTAIRLAESLGLHRDPVEVFGMAPVESHVRRIIWFELCFLDSRTADAQGPRPSIKREDYDARLPLNINDVDLIRSSTPIDKENEWTDMTLSRLRFECSEMQRVVWHDRNRLDKKKVSITYCLGKIESFRKAMETKYKFLDITIPIQEYARLTLDILLLRHHIMILHKYHNSHKTQLPDRLRQILITSGTQQNEAAVKLGTLPQFKNWKWFNGALFQWHTAFLLLFEVYAFPNRREADRIWAFLDFVFEPDQNLARHQKARSIIGAARDRAMVYRNLRRMKEPLSMKEGEIPVRAIEKMSISRLPGTEADGSRNASLFATVEPSFNIASQLTSLEAGGTNSSWTFDEPATLYVLPKSRKGSQAGGSTSNIFMNSSENKNFPQVPAQDGFLNPLDSNCSPSASSGITDTWPPYISSNQQGWRTTLDQSSPVPYQSPETSLGSPPAYGNSSMGLVSGQYIPPVPSPTKTYSPPAVRHDGSDNLFDVSLAGVGVIARPNPQVSQGDPMVLDIDWTEWDKLFPPDTNTGQLDMPT